MEDRLQNILSIALTVSASVVAVALVHREFYAVEIVSSIPGDFGPPMYLSTWKDMIADGLVVGDSSATVKIIEFSDLECPVCRRFDREVRAAREKYPKDVALVFVHFPLPAHRFARKAARAAECANSAGRFAQFVAQVYDKQDSLGLKNWTSYADESGIGDTVTFARCVSDTGSVARIDAGVALGQKIGVHGTPTVIVNGWRFRPPPAEAELLRAVGALLAGRQPFSNGGSGAARN